MDGFPLRQYLGGDDEHGVFLTERGGEEPRKAAIKIFHADPDSTERELRRWRLAAELAHPNLMLLFERGTWQVDTGQLNKIPLLYLVMEYADEDLSQVIPERPLTVAEAKDVLGPALDALAYLHSKGFVHGHVKPSNFMAIDGRLKISSDGITKAGPGTPAPADDVWSLGMTLVEVLTQRPMVWDAAGTRDPALPESLPREFQELVRNMLRRDPEARWTVAQIQHPEQRVERVNVSRQSEPRRGFTAKAGTALVLLMLVLVAGTLLLRRRESGAVLPSTPAPTEPAPAVQPPVKSATRKPSPLKREPKQASAPVEPQGEIVRQAMPKVLPQARRTINGRVVVTVRVDVNSSGSVSNAALESPASSEYFANAALKASKEWKFARDERPRSWILRFEFTRAGTKVAVAKAKS